MKNKLYFALVKVKDQMKPLEYNVIANSVEDACNKLNKVTGVNDMLVSIKLIDEDVVC